MQIGENGPLFGADLLALRRVLAGVRRVALVNVRMPRTWEGEVNDLLAEAVQGWPQARLADWHAASAARGCSIDGTHPTPRGQKVYARLVERALGP